ncbi:hypothetical protein [Vampirovibrio sp.]|uniref:hypothetical protein n=1 Tax=Vampirovibrio sp. TaxID=2717857 RepID=UPI0035939119
MTAPLSSSSPPTSPPIASAHSFRPILLGVLGFLILNGLFTIVVTCSSLNARFNFSYGNFLPVKLKMLQAQQPEQTNVLFLGTSQTNNGFIPTVFNRRFGHGAHSFNVGLPNNRYDIMQAYLRFHQRQYGKPQLILLELSPSLQEKDAQLYYLPALYYRTLLEQAPSLAGTLMANPLLANNVKQELFTSAFSSLRQYRYTFSPVNLLGKVSDKLTGSLALRLPMANAQSPEKQPLEPALEESEQEGPPPAWVSEAMLAGGWYPKSQSRHMKTPQGIRASVAQARKYYIDPQSAVHFEKLEALLAYCQSQGIPVALVTWPNHPAYVREFQKSPLSAPYQQGLARLLKRHPVARVDLNHHLPVHQGPLFADPRHLTPEGARLFSEKLAAVLSPS